MKRHPLPFKITPELARAYIAFRTRRLKLPHPVRRMECGSCYRFHGTDKMLGGHRMGIQHIAEVSGVPEDQLRAMAEMRRLRLSIRTKARTPKISGLLAQNRDLATKAKRKATLKALQEARAQIDHAIKLLEDL